MKAPMAEMIDALLCVIGGVVGLGVFLGGGVMPGRGTLGNIWVHGIEASNLSST